MLLSTPQFYIAVLHSTLLLCSTQRCFTFNDVRLVLIEEFGSLLQHADLLQLPVDLLLGEGQLANLILDQVLLMVQLLLQNENRKNKL